jgi:hypothetical protein
MLSTRLDGGRGCAKTSRQQTVETAPDARRRTTKAESRPVASACTAEREGFEPSVDLRPHRFSRPDPDSRKDQLNQQIRNDEPGAVPTVVPLLSESAPTPDLSPDLANIVAVWPSLPNAVKAGILAMIEASTPQGQEPRDE